MGTTHLLNSAVHSTNASIHLLFNYCFCCTWACKGDVIYPSSICEKLGYTLSKLSDCRRAKKERKTTINTLPVQNNPHLFCLCLPFCTGWCFKRSLAFFFFNSIVTIISICFLKSYIWFTILLSLTLGRNMLWTYRESFFENVLT